MVGGTQQKADGRQLTAESPYSLLKLFTGSINAALILCTPTVNAVRINAERPTTA
jgi:hypothetical protein